MRRLSPPSGQEMREEARSGPRAVEVGRNWTSEESRGLSDGSDTEVQEKGDSQATSRCPTQGLCGKWEKTALSGWMRRCEHPPCEHPERAQLARPSLRGGEGPPGLCVSIFRLVKRAMPVGIQGQPTCSAGGLGVSTQILPRPPAAHAFFSSPPKAGRLQYSLHCMQLTLRRNAN